MSLQKQQIIFIVRVMLYNKSQKARFYPGIFLTETAFKQRPAYASLFLSHRRVTTLSSGAVLPKTPIHGRTQRNTAVLTDCLTAGKAT
jgi:hypothetical protein